MPTSYYVLQNPKYQNIEPEFLFTKLLPLIFNLYKRFTLNFGKDKP